MEDKEDPDEVVNYEYYLDSWNNAERCLSDLLYEKNLLLQLDSGGNYCIYYTEGHYRKTIETILEKLKQDKGIDFYGIDSSLRESLYGYRFLYSDELEILISCNSLESYFEESESELETEILYHISHETKEDINEVLLENMDQILSITGLTQEELMNSSFANKISDVNSYNGYFETYINHYELDHEGLINWLIGLYNTH